MRRPLTALMLVIGLVTTSGQGAASPSHGQALSPLPVPGNWAPAGEPPISHVAAELTQSLPFGTPSPDPGLGAIVPGAPDWASEGLTGDGVKVGIIDVGFEALAGRIGTVLPAAVSVRCYTSVGVSSSSPADCANGELHGTAVAEALTRVAPGVSLYLADPTSSADLARTVAWMTSSGVRVINRSIGGGFEGPGDGTSPYTDSTYGVIDAAVSGGALWVNAAGNAGEDGWQGEWSAAAGDHWLQFSGTDTSNRISLHANDTISVALRWERAWTAGSQDYGVSIFAADSASPLADTSATPDPNGFPVARLASFTAPATGVYELRVWQRPGASATHLQLAILTVADAPLQYHESAGTISTPGDTRSPGELTVGAVQASAPTTIEPYSSQGPTTDGRTKPDIVAVDCIPTTVRLFSTSAFCGTSEAAPFVAGAAALVVQAYPLLTPADLAAWLRSHATPLGSPVPNDTFGAGLLNLGPPPDLTPATTSFVEPPASGTIGSTLLGQPRVDILDTEGRQVMAGPGSTLPVTLALAFGTAGAILTCTGGLTRTAVTGIAAFSGCAIDRAGTYTISATAGSTTAGVSAAFFVRAAGAKGPLSVAAPSSVTYPNRATFAVTAALSSGANAQIILERSTDGGISWTNVVSGTTDSGGHASLASAPSGASRYRVVMVPAAGAPVEVSAPVLVTTIQRLSLAGSVPSGRTVSRGKVLAFTATVGPTDAGVARPKVRFEIYQRVGSRWVLSLGWTVSANSAGQWTTRVNFAYAGSWTVRARALATTTCATSAWSTSLKYTVR